MVEAQKQLKLWFFLPGGVLGQGYLITTDN